MNCAACGKVLPRNKFFMFKFAVEEGKKIEDDGIIARGFTCQDLMCVAKAIGIEEE